MAPQTPTISEADVERNAPHSAADEGREFKFNGDPGQLLQHVIQAQSKLDAARKIVRQLGPPIDCVACWYFERNQESQLVGPQSLLSDDSQSLWPLVGQWLVEQLGKSDLQKPSQWRCTQVPGTRILLVPVFFQSQQPDLLCCIVTDNPSNVDRAEALATLTASHLSVWEQTQMLVGLQSQQATFSLVLGLSQAVSNAANSKAALMQLANYLRKIFSGKHVAVILSDSRGKNPRIAAVSDVESFDATNQVVKSAEAAGSQALQGEPLQTWTTEQGQDTPSGRLFQQYCQAMGLQACLNGALKTADAEGQTGQILGAVLIGGDADSVESKTNQELAARLFPYVASILATVLKAKENSVVRTLNRWKEAARRRWLKVGMAVAAVGLGILMIPMPYRVKCDCEIQPIVRRFVSSPHEGRLESTLVKRGDVVRKGQMLAKMEGRSLRMEYEKKQAELSAAEKRHHAALGKNNIAESQIARLEADGLRAQVKTIQDRLDRLQICSPIDGVVVSGDLEKVEGAMLELGERMFEVAPLDSMVVEVALPESEIQYVEESMSVKIWLDAYPYQSWTGTIRNIRPRTELREKQSVFIAEVEMQNPKMQWRPGMRGTAKVRSSYAPLGWSLFHRGWEKARHWFVW